MLLKTIQKRRFVLLVTISACIFIIFTIFAIQKVRQPSSNDVEIQANQKKHQSRKPANTTPLAGITRRYESALIRTVFSLLGV